MVLYFAKINLESHIYDVYDNKIALKKALDTIMQTFKSGGKYEKEEFFKDGADLNVQKIVYKVHITEKEEEYIAGYIYKDSKIRYKVFDENKEEMKSRIVDSNEVVNFYFDVYHERVGYNTANRFGYREFLEAFEGILNACLSVDENQFRFSVGLCMEGATLNEITDELKQISNIQRLKFKYKAPNPDTKELRAIQNDAEDTLNQLKNANIATKSVIFTAAKVIGINVEAEEIQEQLREANNLHSEIDSIKAMKNGYVEIEAIDSHGNKHISGEEKAIKKEISKIEEFVEACKNVIRNRCLRNE